MFNTIYTKFLFSFNSSISIFLHLFFPNRIIRLNQSTIIINNTIKTNRFTIFSSSRFKFFKIVFKVIRFFNTIKTTFFNSTHYIFKYILQYKVTISTNILYPIIHKSSITISIKFFHKTTYIIRISSA